MPEDSLHIKTFDPQEASESEWIALNTFQNRIRAEHWPGDPPEGLDDHMRRLQSLPSHRNVYMLAVWNDALEVIASAHIRIEHGETNQHMAEFHISVLAEVRRKGIATQLLRPIAETAQGENRSLLTVTTDSKIPAGEAFARRIGARPGLEVNVNQLEVADVDRGLLRQWHDRARERASGFELGLWEGPIPEEDIESAITLFDIMNTQPRQDLQIEDVRVTAERIRSEEAMLARRNTERWFMYVREKASSKLVGYTEVVWNPGQPEHLGQGDTAVSPEYRNFGMGRWLKAAMLEKVLRERPQVKQIRTYNASSNEAMLRINSQLGFKYVKAVTTWQVGVDEVFRYLAERMN